MVSSRFRLFISLILLLTIMIPNISQFQANLDSFSDNICSHTTINGTYGKNLNHLLSTLPSSNKNSTYTGFYDLSYGEIPDKVYVIGFCRGDLKPHACAACLSDTAADLLANACPDLKEAEKANENCTLRYSNSSLSGILKLVPSLSGYDYNQKLSKSSEGADGFDQLLRTLLGSLTSKAAYGGDIRKFAVGHSNATKKSKITIYGLGQCSQDLSEEDCNSCLRAGLGQLPPCCYKAWSYVNFCCNLRYETYLFYDPATDPIPLPPPSSNSGGKKSSTSRRVDIPILVSMVVSMVLIISIPLFLN